jgi:hypothetical protein
MERLWSLAGATGGNRSQMAVLQKRLKQADRQPLATRRKGYGKEGVDGSSPSEGFSFLPAQPALSFSGVAPTGCFGVHRASTSVHGAFNASRSLIACSRPSRARWP